MEKYGIVFTGNEGVKLPMAYAKESIVYSREERKGLKNTCRCACEMLFLP